MTKEQSGADRELIKQRLRKILDDEKTHPRDVIQAARLLRQICRDEGEKLPGVNGENGLPSIDDLMV